MESVSVTRVGVSCARCKMWVCAEADRVQMRQNSCSDKQSEFTESRNSCSISYSAQSRCVSLRSVRPGVVYGYWRPARRCVTVTRRACMEVYSSSFKPVSVGFHRRSHTTTRFKGEIRLTFLTRRQQQRAGGRTDARRSQVS